MGLSGAFGVSASGTGLSYQWSLNGVAIPGATSSTYSTPGTAFADSGEAFTVLVSNSAGSVTSVPARLIVTARAPKAGDLRFQQVDSASTVNGYTLSNTFVTPVFCVVPGGGGGGLGYPGQIGTPFQLSNSACAWTFVVFLQPAGVDQLSLQYLAVPESTFPNWFSSGLGTGPAAADPGSVVTTAGYYPAKSGTASVAIGFVNSSQPTTFDRTKITVDASAFQAAATQEGLHGHVITALYTDGPNVTYYSYGWSGDPSTVYEVKVLNGTLDTTVDMAQSLAAEGYIVTANFSTQAVDGSGVTLVGTRVQGDTMPRPIMIADTNAVTLDAVTSNGYAIVAIVARYSASGGSFVYLKYIGER